MEKAIELGIGFVTGRSHVCKVINNYYKYMINQVKELDKRVNITIFLLYDLSYVGTERSDFYKIVPAVYKDIDIRFKTEYPANNYYLGELPDPKYTEAVIDWDSLRKAYPEFDEEQKKAAESSGEAAATFREKFDPIVEKHTTIYT